MSVFGKLCVEYDATFVYLLVYYCGCHNYVIIVVLLLPWLCCIAVAVVTLFVYMTL